MRDDLLGGAGGGAPAGGALSKPATFFFCIGPPKTGTTLLARLLDQHPDIACLFESFALHPDSGTSLFNPKADKWRDHGFAAMDIERWSEHFRQAASKASGPSDWRALQVARESTFEAVLPEALCDFAARNGVKAVGDKWCWYIPSLALVRRVFPHARFIYTVRDPRAVWNSGQRFRERERGDQVLAEQLAQDKLVAPLLCEPAFLTVRYEDLVLHGEQTLDRLHKFLGVRPLTSSLPARPLSEDPHPRRWDWVPEASQPLEPQHVDKWRGQMTSEQADTVTTRSQAFLERYDYAL